LELKDKVQRLSVTPSPPPHTPSGPVGRLQEDALSALVNLGYKAAEVKEVLRRVTQTRPDPPLKELILEALKELAK
jgi:holliday junction DNA helicase RuvA